MQKTILVTGGCGFIGSNFVIEMVHQGLNVINIDKLTYAGNPNNLQPIAGASNYRFHHADINHAETLKSLFTTQNIDAVVHFAAESHVDRSIIGPKPFLDSNIYGTYSLLEIIKNHSPQTHFIHISTDEVYGDLQPGDAPFHENSAYRPSSPYSASKAASDHFVQAYHRTYGIKTRIIHCSNIYGPRQYPEKLIPTVIKSILQKKPIPVYGKGENIRDWLFVNDAVNAIHLILEKGIDGDVYNVAGECQIMNIDLIKKICSITESLIQTSNHTSDLITFVQDRAGHDLRYAMTCEKIKQLGWERKETLENGLRATIAWYIQQQHIKGAVA